MFNFIYSFFNISTLNEEAKKYLLRISLIYFLFIFLIFFSNILIFLQALEYLSKSQVAVLTGFFLLAESIFAFPAGTLSDSINSRIVLMISAFFYILTYLLLQVTVTFTQFILVYLCLGIAFAFHLENFFNFLQNNYDYYVYEDTTRTIYSGFLSKVIALKFLVLALSVIIGAYIASTYSRLGLFRNSSYLLVLVLILMFLFFKDHNDFKQKKKANKESFVSIIKNSLSYSWKNKIIRFFMVGIVLINIAIVLWEQFFSFLLYADIGKTDSNAGILFACEIIITAILTGFLGIVAGKIIHLKFWYLLSILFVYPILYLGLSYFFFLRPIPLKFNVTYTAIYIVVFFVLMIPYNFNYILFYRTILDLLPENYRGSIMSFILSVSSILGSIFLFLASNYLTSISFSEDFIIIGSIGTLGSILVFISLFFYDFKPTIKQPIGFFTSFLVKTNTGFNSFFLVNEKVNLEKYNSTINNIVKELTAIAMADAQITEEEKEMIDIIITDVQAYFFLVDDLQKDKKTIKVEKKELLARQKENILRHAYENLSKSGNSEDLTKLIEKLHELVPQL